MFTHQRSGDHGHASWKAAAKLCHPEEGSGNAYDDRHLSGGCYRWTRGDLPMIRERTTVRWHDIP